MFEARLFDSYTVGGVSDLILWEEEEQVELTQTQRRMIKKTIFAFFSSLAKLNSSSSEGDISKCEGAEGMMS